MAESSLESFLTCSVCLDILTEPVSLSCHHSFCKRCLTEHWARQPSRPCPVCRRRSSKEGASEPPSAQTQRQWSVCPSHPQVPPLFCLDDSHPLCPICEFSLHPQHRVVSGEEAQRRLKELISSQLQALTEEKHQCEELQQSYEEIQLYAEKQAGDCERHIRAGFSRLHQFLQEEEQRALSALREEQLRQKKNISPELEKLREKLSSVDKIIQELQQQLETHTYRPRQESTPPRLRPKAGLLLDQAKVLGNLGFRVWTRMKRLVTYQPVVLDPNTASPKLSLSDDLSTVRNTETLNKELPEVPERFSNYAIVLGSVGYSSGTHQWDVEVGDHPYWAIGVAKESIERKEKSRVSLKNGLLYFCYFKGQYHDGSKDVKVKKSPEKIRVKLDFNKGTLSFSDADHMTPLCSHTVPKETSTDKLFPFFSVGPADGAKTKELKICEVQSEDSHSMSSPPF
uniref:Uncharacterized protein n=1 Tax=Neogobius melanostomus TaxID=47308 RepID=A0A8C6SP91_9GOBI